MIKDKDQIHKLAEGYRLMVAIIQVQTANKTNNNQGDLV